MNHKLLLPNRFKTVGWLILVPATIAGIALIATNFEAEWLNAKVFAFINDQFLFTNDGLGNRKYFTFLTTNVTNTLVAILFIMGAMLVAFSKERMEDEYIANLRLSSLLWSVWTNYVLLLLALLFVWGMAFLDVMVYNMFTILIIFIIRFNYLLFRGSKSTDDAK